jgi:sn-glycerol 3-phosphate transport system ATP-binding protein
MADVQLTDIGKRFGAAPVVEGVSLMVADGEFLVLLGPSGCGKSTILRMIAGLENITTGELKISGARMNEVDPKDRGVAMVFQNYALYPHKTVRENMGMALKLKKTPRDEMNQRVEAVAEMLGLTDYLERKPAALSGGQRQRVAIGRAIVRTPEVFLFDEPLSNLDAKLRLRMRMELQQLHNRLGVTAIYVTHDQIEAMTLADRIVILNDGRVAQVGTPREVYEAPANMFVAGFIGSPAMNFLTLQCDSAGGWKTLDGAFALPEIPGTDIGERDRVVLGIRPEHLTVGPLLGGSRPDLTFEADVVLAELLGADALLNLRIGEEELLARVSGTEHARQGDRVCVSFDPERLHAFDPDSELTLPHKPAAASGEKQDWNR